MKKEKTIEEVKNGMELLMKMMQLYGEMKEFKKEDNISDDEDENEDFEKAEKEASEKLNKIPEFKEYENFVNWAFPTEEDTFTLERLILIFAKAHPELTLLKYFDDPRANPQKNMLMVFFQAAKHYFNRNK